MLGFEDKIWRSLELLNHIVDVFEVNGVYEIVKLLCWTFSEIAVFLHFEKY